MYAKIRDLNDDTILDEGAWSDLWHGSRQEKKSDQATKDAYDAYRLEKVTRKFEKDGLSPEDARKYAYRKVYGAPVEESRMGFKDLDKLGRENASKVDQECRRRGSADMEPGDADRLRYKVAKEMGLVEGKMSDIHQDAQENDKEDFIAMHKDHMSAEEAGKMWDEVQKQMNEDFDSSHPDFPKAQAFASEKDAVKDIIAKHPEAAKTLQQSGDVFSIYDTDLYLDLFDHFSEDMPYGTQKGRDGDPVEWINDELDTMGILESAPMSEAKQKPYVSSYQGTWMVMDSDGEVVDQFKDKEQAFDFLEQWYDDLLNPKPVKLNLTKTDYERQMDDAHAQIYGEGRKTYFHKGNKEFKVIPEGYKKTKNGTITKVLK